MFEIYSREYWTEYLQVPEDTLPFLTTTPRLLPGENEHDFYRLFELMVNEIIPDTPVEWLVTIDLAWFCLVINRYRSWKNAFLLSSRIAVLLFALVTPDLSVVAGMKRILSG